MTAGTGGVGRFALPDLDIAPMANDFGNPADDQENIGNGSS